jgi:hypothetical protein
MRQSWTEARLDDFKAHTDQRFDAIDRRFDRVDSELQALNGRFDALQRVMIQAAIVMSAAFIGGFAALAGLIATQL